MPAGSAGGKLYLNTGGNLQSAIPTSTGDTVRIVGYYTSNTDTCYFCPDNSYVVL